MKYIKELSEGSKIQGIYFCKSKALTETKNGKPYESVILQDKTGVLDSKVWDPYSPAIGEYEAGDYIEVTGDVIVYANALQAKLYRIRKCQEIEYDPADYMPVSKKDIYEMYEEVLQLTDSVQQKHLKELLELFFKDEEFKKEFRNASAAKTIHHGFIGGLLEHSLSVAKLCNAMCDNYPILNRDLLITAALLHDVGKIRELSPFPENDYTDDGQLLGHIYLGAQMVAEKAAQIKGFPAELSRELQHCILSHHGELEYGSPKKPALIEALVLSMADNLDAKVETFTEQLDNNDRKGWLGYCKFLDTNIRRT